MGPEFIAKILHERRAGFDPLALPYARATTYAVTPASAESEGNTAGSGLEIRV